MYYLTRYYHNNLDIWVSGTGDSVHCYKRLFNGLMRVEIFENDHKTYSDIEDQIIAKSEDPEELIRIATIEAL